MYYAFGGLEPSRYYSSNSYRFGFNGQEKDDNILGDGTMNHALYWEYDTRIGRRWNPDPVMKTNESPYLTFSGNPIGNSDVNRDNSDNIVDKEKRTVDVNLRIYYVKGSESDEEATQQFDSKLGSDGNWMHNGGKAFTIGPDLQIWTVNFHVQFISKSNEKEVDKALENDPAANRADIYRSTNSPGYKGSEYTNDGKTAGEGHFVLKQNDDPKTLSHEIAHALGFEENKHYQENGVYSISSEKIFGARAVLSGDVRMSVVNCIQLANQSKDKVVDIHNINYGSYIRLQQYHPNEKKYDPKVISNISILGYR